MGRAPSPGGLGPKPPGDLAHRLLGPGSRHSHRLTCCKPNFFLLLLKPMGPGLKTLGCYHNPQSADLGGRWMVSEGGALDLANKPLSPASRQPSRVKNSKNAPVLIGVESENPRPIMLMRIGHVCNNNAVLVLHSPGNLACCAD